MYISFKTSRLLLYVSSSVYIYLFWQGDHIRVEWSCWRTGANPQEWDRGLVRWPGSHEDPKFSQVSKTFEISNIERRILQCLVSHLVKRPHGHELTLPPPPPLSTESSTGLLKSWGSSWMNSSCMTPTPSSWLTGCWRGRTRCRRTPTSWNTTWGPVRKGRQPTSCWNKLCRRYASQRKGRMLNQTVSIIQPSVLLASCVKQFDFSSL